MGKEKVVQERASPSVILLMADYVHHFWLWMLKYLYLVKLTYKKFVLFNCWRRVSKHKEIISLGANSMTAFDSQWELKPSLHGYSGKLSWFSLFKGLQSWRVSSVQQWRMYFFNSQNQQMYSLRLQFSHNSW